MYDIHMYDIHMYDIHMYDILHTHDIIHIIKIK